MELHMAHHSLPLIVLLLSLTGPDGDPQIDPEHVTTLEAMRGEETAVIIFLYEDADSRGWPASPEDREFVRFLQDSGVDVAFHATERSGPHFALVSESDANRFLVLRGIAQDKGIPVREMVPPGGMAAAEGLAARTGLELSWWLNAIFLVGTLAVLFWVFAVRDRPASTWER
jgi:hypothetical protein